MGEKYPLEGVLSPSSLMGAYMKLIEDKFHFEVDGFKSFINGVVENVNRSIIGRYHTFPALFIDKLIE